MQIKTLQSPFNLKVDFMKIQLMIPNFNEPD